MIIKKSADLQTIHSKQYLQGKSPTMIAKLYDN